MLVAKNESKVKENIWKYLINKTNFALQLTICNDKNYSMDEFVELLENQLKKYLIDAVEEK